MWRCTYGRNGKGENEGTDEDIEKAVKDAEAHASEDKKKKDEIEARNKPVDTTGLRFS